ncbi:MAG: ATP-binding cassette domain-containing protein [Spiroplasma phoeniceum]|nr:MAG: ATP-binding cassette domain-containing protein [Spiroplasma phoeniceum]UZQ31591.1 MAG: ATP-binding cassette domain-containing protein [Spiroplasma phoeniceum]
MKTKKSNFTPNPDLAIEINGLTKKFKKFVAVNDVNINVAKGKIQGFIGPNGSGKTTTIKSLVGAIIPTSGNF